jgi:hypothetical protein
LSELVLRLMRWSPGDHDAAAALARQYMPPDDALDQRSNTAAVRHLPGAKQLPVGFHLLDPEHRRCLSLLHSAVRYMGAPAGVYAATGAANGVDEMAPRQDQQRRDFVDPAQAKRPTSATKRGGRPNQTGPQRGGAVELPSLAAGGVPSSRADSPNRRVTAPLLPTPVVSFPARFEAPFDPRYGGVPPTGGSDVSVDLYKPHRHATDRGATVGGTDVYHTMSSFFDAAHRDREEQHARALASAERAKAALTTAFAVTSYRDEGESKLRFVGVAGPRTAIKTGLPKRDPPSGASVAPLLASKRVGSAPAKPGLRTTKVRQDVLQSTGAEDGPDWSSTTNAEGPTRGGSPAIGPAPAGSGPKQLVVTAERASLRTRMRVE